jgi:hypothetical protein
MARFTDKQNLPKNVLKNSFGVTFTSWQSSILTALILVLVGIETPELRLVWGDQRFDCSLMPTRTQYTTLVKLLEVPQ